MRPESFHRHHRWIFLTMAAGSVITLTGSGPIGAGTRGLAQPPDVDGNGALDHMDLVALVRLVGREDAEALADGDLNADGAIDRDDVRELLLTSPEIADHEGVYRVLVSHGLVPPPGGGGGGTRDSEANVHHPLVSSADPNHTPALSTSHPNHSSILSATWPNHSTARTSLGQPPHDTTISSHWPPNHDAVNSWIWEPPFTHDTNVSLTWPPNHATGPSQSWTQHEASISRTWPPSHEKANSKKPRDQWPHNSYNSDTWKPNHSSSTSHQKWPDNHRYVFSSNWPADHSNALSTTWPPNHLFVITQTWEDHNHSQATSNTWPPNWHTTSWSAEVGGDAFTDTPEKNVSDTKARK